MDKKDIEYVQKRLPFNKNSKILSVSHYGCMDGTISTIPIHNVMRNTTFMKAKPSHVDELLHQVDTDKFDAIIMTDISPQEKSVFDKYKNLILIDHHATALEYHDPSQMRFVYNGDAAGTLTKKFMSLYADTNLDYLNDVILLGQDYDLWQHNMPDSWGLNELHFLYKEEKFVTRFCRDKKFSLTQEEVDFIAMRKKEFRKVYDKTEYWDLGEINGCFTVASSFLNDICHNLMIDHKYNIVICRNPTVPAVSLRCNNKDVDVGKILKELGFGGGHAQAGGMYEPDMLKLQEKVNVICKKIYEEYPSMRL